MTTHHMTQQSVDQNRWMCKSVMGEREKGNGESGRDRGRVRQLSASNQDQGQAWSAWMAQNGVDGARHGEAAGTGPMCEKGDAGRAEGGAAARIEGRWTPIPALGSHGAESVPWSSMGRGGSSSDTPLANLARALQLWKTAHPISCSEIIFIVISIVCTSSTILCTRT